MRKRRTRNRLDDYTRAHLVLGCGCNGWTGEEWQAFRAAWVQHGAELIAEAEASGQPRPFGEVLFGAPETPER